MSMNERIKQKRLEQGLTLEQLANKIHTSKQTIHRYETGVIENIPSDKIEAIAAALHTTPAWIMGWEKNSEKLNFRLFDEPHIMSLYNELNKEGQEKLIAYAEDLVASGRYKKHNKPEMVEGA